MSLSLLADERVELSDRLEDGRRESDRGMQALIDERDNALARLAVAEAAVRRLEAERRSLLFVRSSSPDTISYMADLAGAMTYLEECPVRLTPNETDMLVALCATNGRAASTGYLYDFLYGHEAHGPSLKIITVMICKLRKKLSGTGVQIETIQGRGYILPKDSLEIVKKWSGQTGRPKKLADVPAPTFTSSDLQEAETCMT